MPELGFHRGTAVEFAHLSCWQWQKRVGYLCVAAGSLSLGGFPFVPAPEQGRVFSAGSAFRPFSPLSPRQGLFAVCPLWAALCTASKGRQRNGCGDQIKGKSKALPPVSTLTYFTGSPCFFRQWWAGICLPPVQKLGCCFCLRGWRDARKSPDSLRDDLDFLFISRLMEISCFMACISPGS